MADNNKNYARNQGIIGATLGAPGTSVYGAVKAKKGRKAAVAGRTAGRGMLESAGGGLAAAALTRGNMGATRLGAIGGGAHGSYAAGLNAKKRGDIKKNATGHDAFGIDG